jgi:hypothetical protein
MRHSFSSTSTYETCAHRYQQVNLLKVYKDAEHPAGQIGTEIHKSFELALETDSEVESEHGDYNEVMEYVRSFPGLKIPEMRLAIDRAWKPCDFFDDKVWYSGIVDVTIINGTQATVFDYKTGKHRLKARQANDNALMLFLHYPFIEDVHFEFLWVKAGVEPDVFDYNRERDSQSMLETILDIPEQIEASDKEDDWPTTKSGLCNGWCPVVSCPHYKAPKHE